MSPAMSDLGERRYQVFISSTFADLEAERQKVLQAVLELKAFPAGMELFPSADEEQWAFIQREIESSDYYIVIVAGKYGSLAEDGRSFTEKEYDHAIGLKKYVMGFLARDLLNLKGSQLEQDPARREKLNAFREKVARNKLIRFYESPEQLKGLVMQALMNAFRMRPEEGWVRAKNARRIEDLEEITKLQKRVMELEAENAKLKQLAVDPTAVFAQGDDTVEWTMHLAGASSHDGKPAAPPAEVFQFRTTWNELLGACFERAPSVPSSSIPRYVGSLYLSKLAHAFPAAKDWLDHQWAPGYFPRPAVGDGDIEEVVDGIERQFLGLGLIEVVSIQQQRSVPVARPSPGGGPGVTVETEVRFDAKEVWRLTEKGNLQFLAIRGKRRQVPVKPGERASEAEAGT